MFSFPWHIASAQSTDNEKEYLFDVYANNDITFYSPYAVDICDDTKLSRGALPAATIAKIEQGGWKAKAAANKERYDAAEKATGVPWEIVAALHYREASMNPRQSILNGQIIGTAPYMGIDGVVIMSNPITDAITAANHFKNNAKIIYGVTNISKTSSVEDLAKAFVAYNRGYMYKNWERASGSPISFDQSPYAMNGYDEKHMDMVWTNADKYTKPGGAVANSLKVGAKEGRVGALPMYIYLAGANAASGTANSDCSKDGSPQAVVVDGHAFPVALTKGQLYNGWYPWSCTHNCHHDNSGARDITKNPPRSATGTPVLAIADGEIVRLKTVYMGQQGCHSIQLKAANGWQYAYLHIQKGRPAGTKVKAGEQIGVIGERRCTGNGSDPHLHIDRGYPKGHPGGGCRDGRGGWGGCRDPDFNVLIKKLYDEMG